MAPRRRKPKPIPAGPAETGDQLAGSGERLAAAAADNLFLPNVPVNDADDFAYYFGIGAGSAFDRPVELRPRSGWDRLSPTYRRRIDKGIGRAAWERGESLAGSRGHSATPEHPERVGKRSRRNFEYLKRVVREPEKYPKAIAELNRLRAEAGHGPIEAPPPGDDAHKRDVWFDSAEEADLYTGQGGIPASYLHLWLDRRGRWHITIDQGKRRPHRRRAA